MALDFIGTKRVSVRAADVWGDRGVTITPLDTRGRQDLQLTGPEWSDLCSLVMATRAVAEFDDAYGRG